MERFNAVRPFIIAAAMLICCAVQGEAQVRLYETHTGTVEPHRAQGQVQKESGKISPTIARGAEEDLEQEREDFFPPTPVDPAARIPAEPTNPPTIARVAAPGDLSIYRNSLPGSGNPGSGFVYNPNEPSAGANGRVVLFSGNIYARVSQDHGQTFSAIDPTTTFPSFGLKGVNGDFVTYYERTRELMLWYLQYDTNAAGNNIVRLAVSKGQRSLAGNGWTYYDLSPQNLGFAARNWFDYPDMVPSANRLYITTNVISGASGSGTVVIRFDLDELAAGVTAHYTWLNVDQSSARLTTGAGTTMYFASHVDNNTIRVYTWAESSTTLSSVDRDVTAWQTGTSSGPSADGTDWLAFDKHRVLAGWVGGSKIGFMWNSAQGGAYTQANVRYVRLNVSDLNVADQGTIWNTDYPYAYPSAHANDRGDVAGSIHLGGRIGAGNTPFPYPSMAVWIADGTNNNTIAPLENAAVAVGTNGPGANRWGDYESTRQHSMYGNTWVATGFILNGGTNASNFEPHYIWFGREQDKPPASNAIYVDRLSTIWQAGTLPNPYHTIADGNFATVPGDVMIIRSGSYSEHPVLDRACTLTASGGSVVIGR